METVLIRAVSLAFQAATATLVVSTSMETTEAGGLLQSPVPTLGDVNWTTSTAVSAGTTTVKTTAFLLAASGIRYLNLSDAVAFVTFRYRSEKRYVPGYHLRGRLP